MRLRLFHKLFLMLAVTALVAVVSMAGVMAINLSRGFGDYLAARDAEEVGLLVTVAERQLAANGGVAALRDGRVTLRSLLVDLAKIEGRPVPPAMPPPGHEAPPPGLDGGPPPPRGANGGRPPPPPEDFGARVILRDANGQLIAGPPGSAGFPRDMGIRRAIHVAGQPVASVQIINRAPPPGGVEARFLASQYQGTLWLALLLTLLAAIPAWGMARMGARRLDRVRQATDAVSSGDFAVRLPTAGHDEIADVARNVNRMAESLARLDSARRRWLAEVSHELRTPLTAIRGELDALEDGIRPLDQSAVASLSDEVRRLTDLVEDLHFLAMTDLETQPCHFVSVDPVALGQRAVERFAGQASSAGISIDFAPSDWARGPVFWDSRRIDQLLANLLTNCLRYTDAPGQVRLTLAEAGDGVRICIEDSAPGVPDEHLAALFTPLFRLDADRSRVTGGSGLGLAVCQAIVRAHGGSIAAQPSSLGGLGIIIDLPQEAGA